MQKKSQKTTPPTRPSTRPATSPTSFLSGWVEKFRHLFDAKGLTLSQAIRKDHDALRSLLEILKDENAPAEKRKAAYAQFKPLLDSHSKSEEQAVYSLSEHVRPLERKTREGFVEHDVANTLAAKIRTPKTRAQLEHWLAQVQVLAELVEHHLDEEEKDLLPQLEKSINTKVEAKAVADFVKLRLRTQRLKSPRNVGVIKAAKRERL